MVLLFISTLKGVAFEWFMKLPVSSIKTWANLKKMFLAHFFEDVATFGGGAPTSCDINNS